MKRVMGIDASSSTIGIAILDYDDDNAFLTDVFYYKPPKKGNITERLSKVRKRIQSEVERFRPDCVALEDIVLHMNKFSTAKTITTLAVLNRTVGTAIFDALQKPPYLYNAMRVRHAIKQDKQLPPKEDIPELVASILKIDFPYLKNKDGNLDTKKTGELKEENFDMADAVACALCHMIKDREGVADKLQNPKKKKRKNKKGKKKK